MPNRETVEVGEIGLFERCGVARVSDLESPQWLTLYRRLEAEQRVFLRNETRFRSPGYPWPSDALNSWSRVWEYPWVFQQISTRVRRTTDTLKIADVGSGVTFFPFAVARLGASVVCMDIDPIVQNDVPKARDAMNMASEAVECRLSQVNSIPGGDGEFDIVYCISVLEHLTDPAKLIGEFDRVLRPGGLLVLTIDLDLGGDRAIGPTGYYRLRNGLASRFKLALPEVPPHPADILRSDCGPRRVRLPMKAAVNFAAREVVKRLLGRKPTHLQARLAVECSAWQHH